MARADSQKRRLRSEARNDLLVSPPDLGINPGSIYASTEVARLLKLAPRTLAAWRYRKSHPELKWRKYGRSVRYLGSDILKFIEG
jgi:hypothetical protein